MSNDDSWRFKRAEELGLIEAAHVTIAPIPGHPTIVAPPVVAGPSPSGASIENPQPVTASTVTPRSTLAELAGAANRDIAGAMNARLQAGGPPHPAPVPAPAGTAKPRSRTTDPATPVLPALAVAVSLLAAAAAGWFGHTLVDRYAPLPAAAVSAGSLARPAPLATAPPPPNAVPATDRPPSDVVAPAKPTIARINAPARRVPLKHPMRETPLSSRSHAAPVSSTAIRPTGIARSERAGRTTSVAMRNGRVTPSFNCRHAVAAVNRMICAEPALSTLDVEMARRYRRAVRETGLERELDTEQAAFLNARSRCVDEACISRIYHQRIDDLDDVLTR